MRLCTRLYGEVNSVKNTTISIWLNMAFISNRKNYMFLPIPAIFRFDDFLAKRVLYNMHKCDVEILSSFYMLLFS
jgi:hypothetical protein